LDEWTKGPAKLTGGLIYGGKFGVAQSPVSRRLFSAWSLHGNTRRGLQNVFFDCPGEHFAHGSEAAIGGDGMLFRDFI
jgi:hypothetical protein